MLGIAVKKQDVIKNLQAENQRLTSELHYERQVAKDAMDNADVARHQLKEIEVRYAEVQHQYQARPHIATYNRMRDNMEAAIADRKAVERQREIWKSEAQHYKKRWQVTAVCFVGAVLLQMAWPVLRHGS